MRVFRNRGLASVLHAQVLKTIKAPSLSETGGLAKAIPVSWKLGDIKMDTFLLPFYPYHTSADQEGGESSMRILTVLRPLLSTLDELSGSQKEPGAVRRQ